MGGRSGPGVTRCDMAMSGSKWRDLQSRLRRAIYNLNVAWDSGRATQLRFAWAAWYWKQEAAAAGAAPAGWDHV